MDIRETAFRKAALLLSAAGAEYAIVYEGKVHTSGNCQFAMVTKDGAQHGNLELRNKTRRKLTGPRVSWAFTHYKEALGALSVGESWKYTCLSEKEAAALQKTVSAQAGGLWGRGNFMTSARGNVLEVLRLK